MIGRIVTKPYQAIPRVPGPIIHQYPTLSPGGISCTSCFRCAFTWGSKWLPIHGHIRDTNLAMAVWAPPFQDVSPQNNAGNHSNVVIKLTIMVMFCFRGCLPKVHIWNHQPENDTPSWSTEDDSFSPETSPTLAPLWLALHRCGEARWRNRVMPAVGCVVCC